MGEIPVFAQQVIGVLVRVAVTFLAGWLAAHGGPKFTDSQIANFVTGSLPVVAVLVWSIWQHYRSRLKLVTALANPSMSEHAVEALIAHPDVPNPSVNSPKSDVPTPKG